ncbi:hypothetical protein [Shouchella shacheensis]|uniref:hypothetical protein n=1 Tax=Shouchella shacheensis TaxID=1649580 RepID=UPI00073FDBD1|nr:hypothetical protein [Shouchella shacheensis]
MSDTKDRKEWRDNELKIFARHLLSQITMIEDEQKATEEYIERILVRKEAVEAAIEKYAQETEGLADALRQEYLNEYEQELAERREEQRDQRDRSHRLRCVLSGIDKEYK